MDAVRDATSGVSERKNAPKPAATQTDLSALEVAGFDDGKTVTKRNSDRGIRDAEANAVRAQTTPQGLEAWAFTRPLLNAQAARVREKSPKYLFTASDGFFSQTARPRMMLAIAVRTRIRKCSEITV